MNFELNQSQKAIINAAREFATKEFDSDLAYELEKKHEFPSEIYKKAAKLGFVARKRSRGRHGKDQIQARSGIDFWK